LSGLGAAAGSEKPTLSDRSREPLRKIKHSSSIKKLIIFLVKSNPDSNPELTAQQS
jgi:hypothetical protein